MIYNGTAVSFHKFLTVSVYYKLDTSKFEYIIFSFFHVVD